jgi:two-component sensor histidine kinase
MLGTLRDITERRRYEERLRLLNRELRHRVKNLFGVIQGLILSSAKGAADLEAFVPALRARIDALAAAHLVGVADEQMAPVSLRDILDAVLKPYRTEETDMTVDGPDLALPARLVTPLGLVLHELATNAVKHGAWAVPRGRIAVEWSVAEAGPEFVLELAWQETLPDAGAPGDAGGTGFGGRLIDASLVQVRGQIRREWRAHGLRVRLSVPLPQQEQAA